MFALVLALALGTSPQAPLSVSPGTQRVLKVPGLKKIAVADPAVADVTVTGAGELLVLGKKAGRTALTLWTPRGVETVTVVVDDGQGEELARRIKQLVSPGLTVTRYGGVLVVDGTLDSVEEADRLRALVGDDPQVRVLARFNPRVLPLVAEQITAALKKAGLLHARATCIGQTLFLEGSVADQAEKEKAQRIADALYARATSRL